MPDNLDKIGKGDDSRINKNQPHEVQYWSKTLNITPAKLVQVIEKVGPMVKDVRKALGK